MQTPLAWLRLRKAVFSGRQVADLPAFKYVADLPGGRDAFRTRYYLDPLDDFPPDSATSTFDMISLLAVVSIL